MLEGHFITSHCSEAKPKSSASALKAVQSHRGPRARARLTPSLLQGPPGCHLSLPTASKSVHIAI